MQAFVDRHDLGGFDHLVDEDGSLWQRFGIASQPSWVFVNHDGSVERIVGALGEDGLRAEVDRLAEA